MIIKLIVPDENTDIRIISYKGSDEKPGLAMNVHSYIGWKLRNWETIDLTREETSRWNEKTMYGI